MELVVHCANGITSATETHRRGRAHTVRLGGVPEHDATEGAELAARLLSYVRERVHINVAAGRGTRRSRRADVDLDSFVDRNRPRPGIPMRVVKSAREVGYRLEDIPRGIVPGVGVVVVGQRAVVVV